MATRWRHLAQQSITPMAYSGGLKSKHTWTTPTSPRKPWSPASKVSSYGGRPSLTDWNATSTAFRRKPWPNLAVNRIHYVGRQMQGHRELSEIAKSLANSHGVGAAYRTSYDAWRWELSWWSGATRHALVLQPCPDGRLEVLKFTTRFPRPGRVFAWVEALAPTLLQAGNTDFQLLGSIAGPYTSAQVAAIASPALPPD